MFNFKGGKNFHLSETSKYTKLKLEQNPRLLVKNVMDVKFYKVLICVVYETLSINLIFNIKNIDNYMCHYIDSIFISIMG